LSLRYVVDLDLKLIYGASSYFQKKKYYVKKRKFLSEKYTPKNWLSNNCSNALSVSFATHVIKLTHSSINTPSLFDCINEQNDACLTTSTLKSKVIDGAVAGNQFAPIFQFLELELNGTKLAEQIAKDDNVFGGFLPENDESKELAGKWIDGFRKALDSGKPSTHSLAKQIYFPIADAEYARIDRSQGYHLLCNVVSSSLAHVVYEKVFDDKQMPIKQMVEKGKYCRTARMKYLQRSHLSVTASNHSNASQLNGKRGGKLHLFSTQSPVWESQLKPPVNRKSLFDDLYNSAIKTEVDYLRDFLIRFSRLDLSIKDPRRKRHLERWVNNIIDEFLFYIATIQSLPSGWSDTEKIRLKKEHRYLLDPYYINTEFQSSRQATDWQAIIRADFALWLNRQLRGKDKQFTARLEHTRQWKKQLEQPLRVHMEPIELEIKKQVREIV